MTIAYSNFARSFAVTASALLVFSVQSDAVAQDSTPGCEDIGQKIGQNVCDNTGVTPIAMGEMDLATQFETTLGRYFRMRMIQVAPGGVIAFHSHANRPSIELVVQGVGHEYRDGELIVHDANMTPAMIAPVTVEHYWLNPDALNPLAILAVDIYQPTPPK